MARAIGNPMRRNQNAATKRGAQDTSGTVGNARDKSGGKASASAGGAGAADATVGSADAAKSQVAQAKDDALQKRLEARFERARAKKEGK